MLGTVNGTGHSFALYTFSLLSGVFCALISMGCLFGISCLYSEEADKMDGVLSCQCRHCHAAFFYNFIYLFLYVCLEPSIVEES